MYRGGGSGYLETDQIQVTGDKLLNISIGKGSYWEDGEATSVTLSGRIVVTAQGGEQAGWSEGGNGWSGGGCYNGGAGGSNGNEYGDDACYTGGAGAGQGTSLPSIQGLHITAGAGGQSCYSYCDGGGGGGVIINGDGGMRFDSRAAQGYGSGGGYYDRIGKSGVVILYV